MPGAPSGEAFRQHVRAIFAEELPEGWQGIGAILDREEADAFVASWRQTLPITKYEPAPSPTMTSSALASVA